jgi:hypothetical protein
MGAIYKVRYEATFHVPGKRGSSYNTETELSVSCDGDAEAAIAKTKKHALNDYWVDDSTGRKVKYVCKRFLLISIEREALADI